MRTYLGKLDIIDRLSFLQIFAAWAGSAAVFGAIYFLLSLTGNGLIQNNKAISGSVGFAIAEYFSFSAAALGFQAHGVAPQGVSRLLAILEVVGGWTLFSITISKLLSKKQEALLEEVYNISFEEKINRIRSALYIFRSDCSKMMERIEGNTISQRRIADLWITFTTLENSMHEIVRVLHPRKTKYAKHLDELSTELILASTNASLEKACDFLGILNQRQIHWQNDTMKSILAALTISEQNIQAYLRTKDINQRIREKLDDSAALAEKLKTQFQVQIEVMN